MMKKTRFIIIISLCLILVLSSFVIYSLSASLDNEGKYEYQIHSEEFFIDSSLFTHKDDETVYDQGEVDLTGFEEKLTNKSLVLYYDSKSGAIRILNKDTGYYWCSDVHSIPEKTNIGAKKRMRSAFKMVYRKEEGAPNEVYTLDDSVVLKPSVSSNTLKVSVSTPASIDFAYEISLNDNSFTLKIPYESINEKGSNRLMSLTMFPYLGNAHIDDIPGYIFIPSGSGGLIRYAKSMPITQNFTSPFYGVDANITKNSEADPLSLPVFGMVHGVKQNALFAEIEKGSTFAQLTFSPANIDLDYNILYPTFYYREAYLLQIPGSEQVQMVPEDYYHEDVVINYSILSGDNASYVGMAKSYQKKLVDSGIISPNENTKENIPLQVEAFGRDYERGLIFKKYKNMTTTSDILNLNARLVSDGINDAFYVLRAFNKGGYSNQSPSSYKFDGALGSLKSLKDLDVYFYYNPVESYNSKRSYPSNVLVNLYNEKHYIVSETDKYKFYTNMNAISKYTTKALDYYDDEDVSGLAFDGIGYRLYGDNNNKLSRSDSLSIYTNLLGDRKEAIFMPNSYLLKNTSKYLNMPLYTGRYRFVTDSVPFLEIALHGYIDYYSPYLNFSSNIDLDILKCIEYGIYPAFLITEKESYNLSDTLSNNYYATYIETVYDLMVSGYGYINSALKDVMNEEIVDRIILEEGVSVVKYANGKEIIVNYTNEIYNYGGLEVKALGFKVK